VFGPLTEVVEQLRSFLLAHPKEIVIMRLKLSQFSAKLPFWEDTKRTQARLVTLQDYLKAQLGDLVGNLPPATDWWHWTVGKVMDTNKRLFIMVKGGNAEVAQYAPWLASFTFTSCSKAAPCPVTSPMWNSKFSNTCCDVGKLEQNQIERRDKFYEAGTQFDKRPLIRLSLQFTYQVFGNSGADSLQEANYAIKPSVLDFYNAIASKDGQRGGDIVPVTNILSGDFLNDCPQSFITFAVCGSLLPPGMPCNATFTCPPYSYKADKGGLSAAMVLNIIAASICCASCALCCCSRCSSAKVADEEQGEEENDDEDEATPIC
jgi:hypothetical protein